jgi:hypothetical protein
MDMSMTTLPPHQDEDAFRAAEATIAQHGAAAWGQALQTYRSLAEAGDPDGAAKWLRIATAISHIEDAQQD